MIYLFLNFEGAKIQKKPTLSQKGLFFIVCGARIGFGAGAGIGAFTVFPTNGLHDVAQLVVKIAKSTLAFTSEP